MAKLRNGGMQHFTEPIGDPAPTQARHPPGPLNIVDIIAAAGALADAVRDSWRHQLSNGGPRWQDYLSMQARARDVLAAIAKAKGEA